MRKHSSPQGGALSNWAVKLVDSIYSASVYSIVGYTGLMFLLAIIAMAVYANVVHVPEFHPR